MYFTNNFGLMLAPGARQDYSLNQYTVETLLPNISSVLLNKTARQNSFKIYHPTTTSSSVENAMSYFKKRECRKIFVLGEQCKSAIVRFLRDAKVNYSIEIFMMNDPDNKSKQFLNTVDIISDQVGNNHKINAFNFFEDELSAALAKALCILLFRLSEKNSREPKVALVTAANVPIIQKWSKDFTRVWNSEHNPSNLFEYNLGSSYSKFNDPKSGYQLTKYLIENHNIDVIVQICGASSVGIVHAIAEAFNRGKKVYFVPYDYSNWANTILPTTLIPLSLVRQTDRAIRSHSVNINASKQGDLITGEVFQNRSDLGFLEDSEIDSIKNICKYINITQEKIIAKKP